MDDNTIGPTITWEKFNRLQAIEAAAEEVWKVKGRHNSQLAFCHLGEALGKKVVYPVKGGSVPKAE